MTKGRFEKELVESYLPSKVVPPEYIRDVLNEANNDFPSIQFEYDIPHNWPVEEYEKRYEELERQILEIMSWRLRWFGKLDATK